MGFLTLFFFKIGIRSRRIVWMAILGFVPVAVSAVLLAVSPLTGGEIDAPKLFPEIGFTLYLHILLPLVAAFVGTGIVADEVEERTLPYLLTRPVAKWRFVLAKTLSACITASVILVFSLGAAYTVIGLAGGPAGWISGILTFFKVAIVLVLGVLAYIPLFGLLGASLRKPVLAGLLFAFGWENIVAYVPARIRLLTIVHYLHDIYPRFRETGGGLGRSTILNFLVSNDELSAPVAVLTLLMLSIVLLGAMTALMYVKEYRLEQE